MHEIQTGRPGGEYYRTTNLMYALYTFADIARKSGFILSYTQHALLLIVLQGLGQYSPAHTTLHIGPLS